MASPAENPFTALTIVVAPAILTNASSLLCFGTANRLARVMDRTRAVSAQLAGEELNAGNRAMYEHQLRGLEVRWNLILRALRCFYMSLGSFAAAALISLFGSMPVFARLARSTVIGERAKDYVLSARCTGASSARIMLLHVLPNAMPR